MAFVNPLLLLGSLLVTIPIVLHLVMRQKPKHLEFPALRFLQQRREANRRRLQLKHLLLLLLRMGAICLLAAALARPSVASAVVGNWLVTGALLFAALLVAVLAAAAAVQRQTRLVAVALGVAALLLFGIAGVLLNRTLRGGEQVVIGDQEAPVAAAFVFDTSPRMLYRQENETRLERAQDIGLWLLRQLPRDSEAGVADSRGAAPVFAVDLGAAKKSVESLQVSSIPQPLPTVLSDALSLVLSSDKARKELYVFTDLTGGAWDVESAGSLRQRLADAKDVLVYVIDVGAEQPQNFALGEVALSGQVVSRNNVLQLQTELVRTGSGGDRAVELYLEEPDETRPIIVDGEMLLPEATRRNQQLCKLPDDGSQLIQFNLQGLVPGTHQGWIKIAGEDSLAIDDIRYFTVQVQDAWPVLVASSPGAEPLFLT